MNRYIIKKRNTRDFLLRPIWCGGELYVEMVDAVTFVRHPLSGPCVNDRFVTPGRRLTPYSLHQQSQSLRKREECVYTVGKQSVVYRDIGRLISIRLVSAFGPPVAQLFSPSVLRGAVSVITCDSICEFRRWVEWGANWSGPFIQIEIPVKSADWKLQIEEEAKNGTDNPFKHKLLYLRSKKTNKQTTCFLLYPIGNQHSTW